MKEFFGVAAALIFLVGVAMLFALGGRAFDLWWFPFKIQMQTEMIRNSNSYYTTELTLLRQFLADYEAASTDNQRRAILQQMRMASDQLKGNIPPDIAAFLQSH